MFKQFMQKSPNAKRKQAGLTLVEALAFLAIFGVVAGGAVAMFGSTSDSAKVNQVATEVNSIKTAVKARALAGTPFANIHMESLKAGGALSTNIGAITGTGDASYGSHADGTRFLVDGGTTTFDITVSELTDANCASLILALANSGRTNTPACSSGAVTFTYR